MIEVSHPIEKIHHINHAFNRRFSRVLYWCGALVTFLLLAFPYSLRTALAFFVNIFFNRPRVYLDYFRKVGNYMSIIPVFLLYAVGIGLYAICFKIIRLFKRKRADTRWITSKTELSPARYRYQS